MGAPLGSLAGLAFGGVVASLWGWRAALVLASLPGILLAVIAFFTLVEPRRFQAAESAAEHSKAQPFWQALTGLLRNAAYMRLTIATQRRAWYSMGPPHSSDRSICAIPLRSSVSSHRCSRRSLSDF